MFGLMRFPAFSVPSPRNNHCFSMRLPLLYPGVLPVGQLGSQGGGEGWGKRLPLRVSMSCSE